MQLITFLLDTAKVSERTPLHQSGNLTVKKIDVLDTL